MNIRHNILLTGGAGFIGSHLAARLLCSGQTRLTCLDNFDPFYDREQKQRNLAKLLDDPNFRFIEADICSPGLAALLADEQFDAIVHLAARAGVRPSIADPLGYQATNVMGTQNLLELAKTNHIPHFVFASSSSVYGVNPRVPWKESDTDLMPISPYAATKISGELLGRVYSSLFGIRFVALRFFTVFGPAQRPDLAIHKFAMRLLRGEPIQVFGDGTSARDYTYVDDIVDGIMAAIRYSESDYEIINLGNSQAIQLDDLISAISDAMGVRAICSHLPGQPGDVPRTCACIDKAGRLLNYTPRVGLDDGLLRFKRWLEEAYTGAVT